MAKRSKLEIVIEVNGKQAGQEYQRMQDQVNALKQEQAELTEGTAEYIKTTKELDKANKELKKLEPTYNQLAKQKRELNKELRNMTIGTDEYNEKTKELAKVNTRLKSMRKEWYGVSQAQEATQKSSSRVSRVMQTIGKLNPFGLMLAPLTLVVGAVTMLFNAFKRTEQGAKLLTTATGAFNAIMSMLAKLAGQLAERLVAAFENPQQALKDFGKMLVENITNRIKGALMAVGSLAKALGNLIKGDMQGATRAAKEAGQAFLQLSTGMDAKQQQAFAEKIKETTKEVRQQTTAFINLEHAKRRNIKANAELSISLAQLTNQENLYNSIADDNTKSFKEREDAASQAMEVAVKRAEKEIQLAKNNLSLLSQEINLRRANGEDVLALEQARADALAQVAAAEGELTMTIRDNERLRAELKQDRLEKDLDYLIEILDTQKSLNERAIADESLPIKERQKLLLETQRLADESFKKQIETIQQFTGVQVDANELINESNAVAALEKARQLGLSEVIEGRLSEIIRERQQLMADIADTEKALSKEKQDRKEAEIQKLDEQLDRELALELEKLDTEKKARDQAAKEEKKRQADLAQARINTEQAVTDAATESFDVMIGLLSRDEEARKKNAQVIKAFEKAKVLTNLYAEISAIWRNANSSPANALLPGFAQVLAGVQTGLAVGRAAVAVRNIDSQQFAAGGFTGKGGKRDHTGHRVAGVVHDHEWVAPKWQVQHPVYGAMIQQLENGRMRGFAGGGFTSASTTPSVGTQQAVGFDGISSEIRAMRNDMRNWKTTIKAYTVYDDFQTAASDIETSRANASF